ncbi:uncharacterized protein LOC142504501 [Primulina tabacum]|uniref:uncharacterized protein LOC142504501 n=1 Tax=Primulina tabacum TaxID=48773 RepID=UPI003F59FBCC
MGNLTHNDAYNIKSHANSSFLNIDDESDINANSKGQVGERKKGNRCRTYHKKESIVANFFLPFPLSSLAGFLVTLSQEHSTSEEKTPPFMLSATMFSLNGSSFLNNSISGLYLSSTKSTHRRAAATPVLVAAVSSNGRPGDRNVTILMENTLKEMRETAPSSPTPSPVSEEEFNSTVGGGVEDVYGVDSL